MRAKFRAKWSEVKKTVLVTTLLILVAGVIIVIFAGYLFNWTWTGLSPYTSPPHPANSDFLRGKTFWDWLQLLVIPVAAAFLAFWLNRVQANRERTATEQRVERDREIARDNQRETALQTYLDKISELLFQKNLRESKEGDEVRTIARARTLTMLRQLDRDRKASLLQFLSEAKLLPLIDLERADLGNTNLSSFDLSGARLSKANLKGANLSFANLEKADLSEADCQGAHLQNAFLWSADLTRANFSGADLSKATLIEAQVGLANFSSAILVKADLGEVGLDLDGLVDVDGPWVNFVGAHLEEAYLKKALLQRGDFRHALLCHADLTDAVLLEANLSSVKLTSANLSRAVLSEADLSGADLNGADLNRADLSKSNLRNATLHGATLSLATLDKDQQLEYYERYVRNKYSNKHFAWDSLKDDTDEDLFSGLNEAFESADIASFWSQTGADLKGSDLRDANLTEAKLGGIDLTQTDLRGADLSRADLRKARIEGKQLQEVKSLQGANLSDELIRS